MCVNKGASFNLVCLARALVDQKKVNEKLEKQISDMYKFVHKTYDPAIEILNEIADAPEGKALLKKLHEAKIQEYEKSRIEG